MSDFSILGHCHRRIKQRIYVFFFLPACFLSTTRAFLVQFQSPLALLQHDQPLASTTRTASTVGRCNPESQDIATRISETWKATSISPYRRPTRSSGGNFGVALFARPNRRLNKSDEYDRRDYKRGPGGDHGGDDGQGEGKGKEGGKSRDHGGISGKAKGEVRRGDAERPLAEKEKPEFSRLIEPDDLRPSPRTVRMEATAEECASLAKRFSLGSMQSLRAEVTVSRGTGTESRKLTVKGRVVSKFTQLCYATRAPFSVTVDEEFRSVVQEVSWDSVDSTLWSLDKDSDTDDEIMEGDPLDVGEIAAQEVGLLIDPFASHPQREVDGLEKEIVYTLRDFEDRGAGDTDTDGESVEDPEAMRRFFEDPN